MVLQALTQSHGNNGNLKKRFLARHENVYLIFQRVLGLNLMDKLIQFSL
jgi:hypothetical protein